MVHTTRLPVSATVLLAAWLLAACGGGGGGPVAGTQTGGNGSQTGGNMRPVIEHADFDSVVAGPYIFTEMDESDRLFRSQPSCSKDLACTYTDPAGDTDQEDWRAYLSGINEGLTSLPARERNNVWIGWSEDPDEPHSDTFGIWGRYNLATVVRGAYVTAPSAPPPPGSEPTGTGLHYSDTEYWIAFASLGRVSGSNPLAGSATWTGAMAGVKVGSASIGEEVAGDAALSVDLAATTLDLEFTNIAERSSGAGSPDIRWQDVAMRRGAFQASGLDGRFYGPNHEEAGGIFERSGIAGAFSLARQ